MFGYIRPLECELRVREQKEYRAYYCGLCKTIGKRYGLFARLSLNYDCAFLCAFLTEHGGNPVCEAKRCMLRPFRGKMPVCTAGDGTAYAADVNVLLFWLSLEDRWMDERSLWAWLLKGLFRPYYKKAAAYQPALVEQVKQALLALHALERQKADCSDEPSDAFGSLMRAVISHAPGVETAEQQAAGWMFYNLGRWIYLADAWDDRAKDAKRGAYNVLNLAGIPREQAEFLLYISLTEAEKGYDLLDMAGVHGLVDNIMHDGCRMVTRQLLREDKKESMHESL